MGESAAPDTGGDRSDLLELRRAYSRESANFLHMEHQHLGSSLLTNEEGGEKRVNIFFALIAAVTAAVGLAARALEGVRLPWAVFLASLTLLALGLLTLRRLMGRNVQTTELLSALRRIRAAFVWRHPEALRAVAFAPPPAAVRRERRGWGLGKAGFVEVVAVTNSILAAAAATAGAVVLHPEATGVLLGSISLGILVSCWIDQLAWVKKVYRTEQAETLEREKESLAWWRAALDPIVGEESFHAGVGLVVENAAGQVLALERADVEGAWQLPQGGLEEGEAPETAAWRELQEETGLGRQHVELVDSLEVWLGYELPPEVRSFKTGRGQVHRWFLFRLKPGVSLPAIENTDAEFVDHRWTTLRKLTEQAVEFRRPVYRILADQFK